MRATIEPKASGATAPNAEAADPTRQVTTPEWESDLFLTSILGTVLLAIFLIFAY
jgi:hypothetical protein